MLVSIKGKEEVIIFHILANEPDMSHIFNNLGAVRRVI